MHIQILWHLDHNATFRAQDAHYSSGKAWLITLRLQSLPGVLDRITGVFLGPCFY